jgi:BASS family bile acid:Na+ symporter
MGIEWPTLPVTPTIAATIDRLTRAFPVWVMTAAVIALIEPRALTWFSGPLITGGLGLIMLGMGLTLEVADFARVAQDPVTVATGFVLQYTVMPALGWAMGYLFDLPTPFAVGLVLVACCPGGTASNVVTFLARGDVSLSVTMTALSTLMAAVMTPLLTELLVGSRVEVSVVGLLISTLQVVIVPVVAGVALTSLAPRTTARLQVVAPLAAVITIALIVGSILGAGRDEVMGAGLRLLGAVAGLHAGGFALGYVCARIAGRSTIASRTISIEVGMQNSGLGVVLARQHFASPLVAIPCAISSLTHSVLGSMLAAWWRRDPSLSSDELTGAAVEPNFE